jgi:hypothetical protein
MRQLLLLYSGCYDYPRPTFPRIDALAAEGVLFSHGTAQRYAVVTAFEVTRVASAFSSRAHHVSRVGQRVLTCA